ncbi:hypothetical protein [Mycobacterium sp. OTB74]|jgi:hypothetical protein|uniref:hypothetical protein n=1 Tax=Mycobacterium sp. OTB74 TaxID=1853452 RepID=UPI002474BA59|nr:hypothetical protein [Mycobacterium sp. OTB74]MDH6245721.1 hypothetical protein [Mycobacterium sp. OTB74]
MTTAPQLSAGDDVQLAPRVRRHGHRCGRRTQGAARAEARLKQLLAEAELEKDALREVAKGKS